MTIRFSTGLRNNMLGAVGLKGAMDGGKLIFYTGSQPASADNAATGTKLLEITVNGDGVTFLNFDAPSASVLQKAAGETWSGTGLANGVAGWCRFYGDPVADNGSTVSTVHPRIDGSVSKTSGDINLSNTTIVTGQPNTIDQYTIQMREA